MRPLHLRLEVTWDERLAIKAAAKQAGLSTSKWAALNLVQVAEMEGVRVSASAPGEDGEA